MTSLRRTALIRLTLLLTVVGAIAVALSYRYAEDEAASFLDGQLRQIALNAGDSAVDDVVPPMPHDPEDDFVIAVWNAAGTLIRSPSMKIEVPPQHRPGFATVKAGGKGWRVYTAASPGRTVQVAQRMTVREEIAAQAAIEAAAPVLVLVPLAWLVIGGVLGRVLGRLSGVAAMIAARSVDSREPIPTRGIPAEVRPLVEAMNVLISRLQHALEQQKRFVSDAAHELRTPLTALSLQIDNLQRDWRECDGAHPTGDVRAGVRRVAMLMEQLLTMARFDAPVAAEPERIDLGALVRLCVADHVLIASNKGVDLGLVATDGIAVWGIAGELRILFSNLVENAIRYTPPAGTADVTVRTDGQSAVVEIIDSGCGVADADLPRLFDRFFRAAPPDIEGNGLGLSIAAVIAQRHAFRVSVRNRDDRSGFIATVLCPLA